MVMTRKDIITIYTGLDALLSRINADCDQEEVIKACIIKDAVEASYNAVRAGQMAIDLKHYKDNVLVTPERYNEEITEYLSKELAADFIPLEYSSLKTAATSWGHDNLPILIKLLNKCVLLK